MNVTGEQLTIVRRWFEELGAKVEDVPLDPSKNRNLPSLGVEMGSQRFNVIEDNGGAVILLLSFVLADDVVEAARKLGREDREKVLLLLKTALMENPRTGWTLEPQTVTAIDEVRAIYVNQRFRVQAEDATTYNRFQDAVQEISTARVKIQVLYETTVGARPPSKNEPPRTPPSDETRAYG